MGKQPLAGPADSLARRRSLIEAEEQIERGELATPEESDADIEELARTLQGR